MIAYITDGDLAQRLEVQGYRVRGNRAQCPGCNSRRLDLAIAAGRDGRTLVHCHRSGCAVERICDALEIDPRGLHPFSVHVVGRSSGDSLRTPHSLPVVSLLAAHGAGVLQPVPVTLVLPRRAGRLMRVVAADLELLFGLRFAVADKRSLLYAVEWAADRLDEDRGNVRRALESLVRCGAIGRAGTAGARPGRKGTSKYRLPSELMRRVDLPTAERARETARRVAAVGRVQPLAELHDSRGVPICRWPSRA